MPLPYGQRPINVGLPGGDRYGDYVIKMGMEQWWQEWGKDVDSDDGRWEGGDKIMGWGVNGDKIVHLVTL